MDSKRLLKNISTQNYSNKLEVMSSNLLKFYRFHRWPEKSVQIDVFNRYWSLAFINGHHSKVAVEKNGKKVLLSGPLGVYIPPFSIIKWHILSPEIEWLGYLSDLPLGSGSFAEPIIFPYEKSTHPNSIFEIRELLEGLKSYESIANVVEDSLAKKIKVYIDENFAKKTSIQEMALFSACPVETLIRRFKLAYGITPVQYRLKLRLTEALIILMTESVSVNQIAYRVGFNDISFFNKVFKREMNATPSSFQLKTHSQNKVDDFHL